MRLVLVDEDSKSSDRIRHYLTGKGLDVAVAKDSADMQRELEQGNVDIVLLDPSLPGEDELALTRYVRDHTDAGIIVLSRAGNLIDRVISLELGADDYLQKPIELRELLARINSLHRRVRAGPAVPRSPAKSVRFAGWRLDLQNRKLFAAGGGEVPLTSTEFALLRALVSRPLEELSREQLMREIKGRDVGGVGRNIDVHVLRLRQKIEKDPREPALLKTVHGVGYTFCADVVEE